MGPRLIRALLLALVVAPLAGCGGERIAASESLETQLKDANARTNDGTSMNRQHSLRRAEDRANRI